ncbi:hypothetical protein FNF31_00168 [Cafeteria roenbergensis]|uniref:Uncharacterized protein n=1 Tax=Cafeteria roenbergensis TaxID=33653 RepID=A0A5A8DUQ7_CAFRO|nr:hypothetical protein FNF31_00168 [Cafeteria roenbergensis]
MSIAESAAELEQYYDRNAVPKVDPATLANKVLRPATFRAFMADYQISLMQVAQATQLSESLLEAWLTGSLRKNPEARRLIVPKLLALKHEEREFRKLASAAKRDAMATGGGATHARKEPPAWHGTGVGAATSADAAGAPAAPHECPPPREDAPFTSAWRSAEASDSPVSSGLMLRVPPSLPEAVFRSCAPQPAAGEQPAAGAAEGASAGAAAHPEPHGSAAGCWREARRVSDADGELSADDYTSEALPRHGTFSHGEGEIGPLDCTAVLSVMLTGAVASAAFDAVLELEDALAEARGIAEGRRSSTRRPKVLGSASEGMLSDIDDGAGSALEGGRWPREDEVEDGYFDDGLSDGESDDSDEESARDGDPEAEALAAKGEPGHRRPGKYVPTALRMSARPFDYQQQPASWSGVPYSSPGEGADRGPKRHRVDAEEFLGPAATVPTPSAKPVSRSTPMRSTEADLGAADILLTVAGGSAISGDDKRSDRMRAPPGPASIVSSLQDGGSGGEPDGFAQQNPLMPPRLEGGPDARHGYRAGLPSDRGAGSPELGVYTRQGFGTHAPPATSQGLPRVNSGLAVSMLSLSSAQQSTSQQRQVPSSASAMMVGPGGVMPSGSSGRYGDAMGLPNASSLSVLSGVYTSSQHPGLYIPGLFAGRGAASDLQDAAAQPTMAMGAATVLSGMSKGASQGHGGPRAGRGPSAASPMLSRPGSVGSSDRGNPLPGRGPAYPRPQGLARQLDEGDGGITIAEAFAGHMTDAERRAAYFEATTGAAHSEQQPGARDSQGSRRLPATRRVPPGRPGSSHYSMFGV